MLRAGLAGLILTAIVVPLALGSGAAMPSTNDNAKTLTVAVPGPFNGCSFLDQRATPSSNAILDLLRPSAFLTSPGGALTGAAGPIASAELTSLTPETVVYTIAPGQKWSDGTVFNGIDLVAWWQRAASLSSVLSDGYRAIKSIYVTNGGLTVTAVFNKPYAEWNLLFRDIEQPGTPGGCAISNLRQRPSLGPYVVQSATPSRIVLRMNKHWTQDPSRFGRIVLSDGGAIPTSSSVNYVSYSLSVNVAQERTLGAHPFVLSRIGTSSSIEELAFAPSRPLTRLGVFRKALSWSLNRQTMINELWGAVTFSPTPATSALISQGQSGYPAGNASNPAAPTATTTPSLTAPSLSDCLNCAVTALRSAGYLRTSQGLVDLSGVRMSIHMVAGPSQVDQATAALVAKSWQGLGITVSQSQASSDANAALAVSRNEDDVAVFARPTLTTPAYTARSWSGPTYLDAFNSGIRLVSAASLYSTAITNFNSVAANATWLALDRTIMTSYWARPLFTPPSLVEWSNSLVTVYPCLSVPGFLDQATNWSISLTTSHS
jgi:ABC-type transport system substrate-binding protein